MIHFARPDRDELICSAMPAAKKIATLFARQFSSIDCDDAVSAAYEALCVAAHHLDPARHATFAAFARACVKNALFQLLRANDSVPWSYRAIARRYHRARLDSETASFTEIAAELGLREAYLRRVLDGCATRVLSLSCPLCPDDDPDRGAIDRIAADGPTPEDVVVDLEMARVRRRVMRDALADLPEPLVDAVKGAVAGNLAQHARERGVPLQTMHSRLQRARAILRPVLAQAA